AFTARKTGTISKVSAGNTQPFIPSEIIKTEFWFNPPQRCHVSRVGVVQLAAQQIPHYHNPNRQLVPENTQTTGLSMFFSPGKWMSIAAMNLLCRLIRTTCRAYRPPDWENEKWKFYSM